MADTGRGQDTGNTGRGGESGDADRGTPAPDEGSERGSAAPSADAWGDGTDVDHGAMTDHRTSDVDDTDVDYGDMTDHRTPDVDGTDVDYGDMTDHRPPDVGDSDVAAARASVADAYRVRDARDAVVAARTDGPPADGQDPVAVEVTTPPGTKEVEFVEPGPAKEVEFVEPGPAKEVEFVEPGPAKEVEFVEPGPAQEVEPAADRAGPDTPVPEHTPREQRVVDDAKRDLGDRVAAGERLGGDPVTRADQWHVQGRNDEGYLGTCGLASTADVLRTCGEDVSENDVVGVAVETGRCNTDDGPRTNGATTVYQRDDLLNTRVPSEVVYPATSAELAAYVEADHGVIARVNSDRLWADAGGSALDRLERGTYGVGRAPRADHAVVVTGTVRDPSGRLDGFVINDHGSATGAGRVVDLAQWDDCWADIAGDHATNVTREPISTDRRGTA